MKKLLPVFVFFLVFLSLVLFVGRGLNPFDRRMFSFHDDTQAARIAEIAVNIISGHFPPRLAPHLSFGLGFPVFNFYAPFSYYVTTILSFIGFGIPMGLKASFFLAVMLSFVTMYLFLKSFFDEYSSILGGILYATSTWFAIEIFVRGNLAECWFLVLFPLSLKLIYSLSQRGTKLLFITTALVVSFLLTTHNVLSLLGLCIIIVFSFLFKAKKRSLAAIGLGLILGAYFLIPALLETGSTQAAQLARRTRYQDHFLCIEQMWGSPKWEYGGSAAGCQNDGMPFVLGKIAIVTGSMGLAFFTYQTIRKTGNKRLYSVSIFVAILALMSVYLTTYQSSWIWNIFSPILSLFQFPWRFLVFVMFGIAFFGTYLVDAIRIPLRPFIIAIVSFALIFSAKKYFSKPWLMTADEFANKFLSANYISRTVAYNMPEYLTSKANHAYWKSFDSSIHPDSDQKIGFEIGQPATLLKGPKIKILTASLFQKEIETQGPTDLALNIHYIPFWSIFVNNAQITPTVFDKFGRPVLKLTQPSLIHILYHETLVEVLANILSLGGFIFVLVLAFHSKLWTKLKHITK